MFLCPCQNNGNLAKLLDCSVFDLEITLCPGNLQFVFLGSVALLLSFITNLLLQPGQQSVKDRGGEVVIQVKHGTSAWLGNMPLNTGISQLTLLQDQYRNQLTLKLGLGDEVIR